MTDFKMPVVDSLVPPDEDPPVTPTRPPTFDEWQQRKAFDTWKAEKEAADPTSLVQPALPDVGALHVATSRARHQNVGVWSEAFGLAERTGLPVGTVARNIDAVRAQAGDADFDPATFVREHPATARWLSDEAQAAASQNEWAKLGGLERLIGRWRLPHVSEILNEFGRAGGVRAAPALGLQQQRGMMSLAFERGTASMERIRLMGKHGADYRSDRAVAAEVDRLHGIERSISLPDNQGGFLGLVERSFVGLAGSVAPSMLAVMKGSARHGIAAGGALGAVAVAGGATLPAALPAAGLGWSFGSAVGGFSTGMQLMKGEALDAMERAEVETGTTFDPLAKELASSMAGTLGGALEFGGVRLLAAPFGAALSRAVSAGVSRALVVPTTRSALMSGVREYGKDYVGELGTETVQQAFTLLSEHLVRENAGVAGVPVERVLDELLAVAVETALSMALVPIPGASMTTVTQMGQAAEATAARDRLAALGASAEGIAIRERLPAQFRALVQADIDEHGAVKDVFIPSDRLAVLLQEAEVDPAEFIRTVLPGQATAYAQAVATGGDVVIPLADYLTSIAGTDLHTALLDDLTLRPGQMSAREAKALIATAEKDYAAIAEEMQAVAQATPDEEAAQRVVNDITAQLEATGVYTPEQVSVKARAVSAPYIVLTQRFPALGTAWDLYASRNIRIVGPASATDILQTADALARAEQRGATPEALSTLRNRMRRLTQGRETLRTVLRDEADVAGRTESVEGLDGKLARALKPVETDALVVEYLSRRDRLVEMEGQLAGFRDDPATSEALELVGGGHLEDADAVVPRETRMLMAALARDAARLAPSVRRLERELARREIDADTYAAERDLVGDASFDVDAMDGPLSQSDAELLARAGETSSALPDRERSHAERQRAVEMERAMERMDRLDAFDREVDRVRSEIEADVGTEMLLQAAFHGTPHTFAPEPGFPFGRFREDKVGTGEGAQAFGHGVAYVAEAQGVGQGYRDALAREVFFVDGERVTDFDSSTPEGAALNAVSVLGVDTAIERAREMPDRAWGARFEVAAEALRGRTVERRDEANLYQVDVSDAAVAKFLDWDKLLSEQPPAVQAALSTLGFTDVGVGRVAEMTGEDIYRALSPDKRLASKLLLDAGIPGIKYLDAGSRGQEWLVEYLNEAGEVAGSARFGSEAVARASVSKHADPKMVRVREEGTRNLVVFDEDIITITHRNGEPVTPTERADFLDQSGPAKAPNAFIIPSSATQTIGLLGTANLSSFLHEMGHEYLNLLAAVASRPDAPQSLKDDLAIALEFVGVASIEETDVARQTTKAGKAKARAAAEKWARTFESYLATAEAPSAGLFRAFTRFRIWMAQVYERAQAMLVPVAPEIRGVFDRLLATDAEIAATVHANAAGALFESAEQAGMSDAAFAAYRDAAYQRDAAASALLLKQVLAEQNQERTAAWQEREADVREAVATEVDADPLQRAVVYLRTGALPDGTKAETPVKLSKAVLVTAYGDNITKTLPRGTFAVQGGVDADSVALLFGFADGDALVTALQSYEARGARIDRLVNQQMRRAFPDLLHDSPAMADAAQDALHRAPSDDLLLLELKQLGKAVGITPPNVVTVKQVAREIIGQTAERDLRPARFQQAEAKAGRLAGEAMRKGDVKRAEFHKRQQLLNHILYREAVKAQQHVGVIQRFFARMEKGAAQERLGKAGQMHRDAMNAILDRYEFRRLPLRQLRRRDALNDYVAKVAEDEKVLLTIPPEVLADAAQTNFRTLTIDALEGVYDAGQQIWHVATTKDKLLRAQTQRTLDEEASGVIGSIVTHHKLTPRAVDYHPLSLTNAKQLAAGVDAWHLAPEFLFRWLDGDTNGPVWEAFFRPLADAESAENRRLKAAFAEMEALEDMVGADRRRTFWTRRIAVPGFRAKVTGQQLITIALNWGSASNREALLESTVDGEPLLGSPDAVQAALSLLTKEELAYVQAKWDYLNTYWPDIKALEESMTGVAPEKIESSPFTVRAADGTVVAMQGGYYPLKYDGRLGGIASIGRQLSETLSTELGEISARGYARAATKHGWTEERAGSGGRPVDLSMQVFNAHVVNVIHDLTHRRAVRDVAKLYERKDVRSAIVQSAGQHLYDSIKPWLARVANPVQTFDASFAEKVLAAARTGTTVVNMGLKATTAVTQILGFTQSVDVIGVKYMRKGLLAAFSPDWRMVPGAAVGAAFGGLAGPVGMAGGAAFGAWVGGLNKARRHVMDESSEMENRRTNYNRDVRDFAVSRRGKWARRDEFFFAFVGLMDMVVSVPTWLGAYQQSMAELSPDNHADAVAYADSIVRMTQGSGSPKDLSRIQGGPELRRLLTMHYTFFSRLYGLFRRSGSNLKEGRWGLPRFAASMTAIWFASSILSELIAGRGPEDDEDWREWMLVELMRYTLSPVVGVREIARAVGPGGFGYKMTPAEDALIATSRTLNVGYRATIGNLFDDGEEFELTEADLKAMVSTAGYWGRLPSRQAWITGSYMYDWWMGYEAPETPTEATRGALFVRPR